MGALEPVISKQLLDLHYSKHHKTYVTNYNKLAREAHEALSNGKINQFIELSNQVKFHGGGHANHEFFWESLAPIGKGGGELPAEGDDLFYLLSEEWDSPEKFMEYFTERTAAIQGSGWGWLCLNLESKKLEYRATLNQDTPKEQDPGLRPLLNMDVWEHAYYLDYKNVRPNYLKEMWKIMDW